MFWKLTRTTVIVSFFLCVVPFPSPAQQKSFINVDQLVQEALQNNSEILAAKRKWEAYKEKVPQARALPDPMLGAGIINLPTNFSFQQEDMTMKEISVSQKFPFFGKRTLMGEMAEKEAEAVFNEIQEKVNRIIKEVKSTYYDLSHVYRTTEVTEYNKKILETFAGSPKPNIPSGRGYSRMCSRPTWRSPKWSMS